jgi:hypothetical protein
MLMPIVRSRCASPKGCEPEDLRSGRTASSPLVSRGEAVEAALSEADSCVVVVSKSTVGSGGVTSAEWSGIQDAVWRRPELKVVPVLLGSAELPPFLRPWRIVGPVPASEPQRAVDRIVDAIGAEDGRQQDLVREGDEAAQQRFDEIRASLQRMRREL